MRLNKGFSLIELMIVIAIIGILSAIAVPAYGDYVKRAKITEAISALGDMRVKMEQYFQDNRTYVGSCGSTGVAAKPADSKNFTFSCLSADLTATGYKVTATGISTTNMKGFVYTINEANVRASPFTTDTNWTGSTTCWVLKKDGSC